LAVGYVPGDAASSVTPEPDGAPVTLSSSSDQGFTLEQFSYDFKTTGQFTIGAFPGGFYSFNGHLDDMRVYKRVLSDEEIAKIAQEN
jgi:hypothetical protein